MAIAFESGAPTIKSSPRPLEAPKPDIANPVAPAKQSPSPVVAAQPAPAVRPALVPPCVTCVADTGLEAGFLADLIIKVAYFRGAITGARIAQQLRLPYSNVIDGLIEQLKQQKLLEVQGASGVLSSSYIYLLTDRGHQKAKELLERSMYAGACPVTLDDYTFLVNHQRARDARVTRAEVEKRFSSMVLDPKVLEQLGPAINSGESIFVFGAPGNGKTTIAEIATSCLGGDVYIPYAIYVEGEIIRVYDEALHEPIDETEKGVDERWVRAKRPTVIAGGELTLDALDLTYSRESRIYEAPLQMKANCGMFLIDDFGRQQCSPTALLNRWIVPLEKHVDYLNTVTGIKVKVPFEELIVFSTNLAPQSLVDDAFLRRLQYKIEVVAPTLAQFKEIFKRVTASKGVVWGEDAFYYLMETHYKNAGREWQACHARDLINQVLSMARYGEVPAIMSRELLDRAVASYFVRLGT